MENEIESGMESRKDTLETAVTHLLTVVDKINKAVYGDRPQPEGTEVSGRPSKIDSAILSINRAISKLDNINEALTLL